MSIVLDNLMLDTKITTEDAQPRKVSLWRIVPQRPNVLAVTQADVASNRVLSVPGTLAGEEASKLHNWPDAVLACRVKKYPPPYVLFRPEEIHLASGAG